MIAFDNWLISKGFHLVVLVLTASATLGKQLAKECNFIEFYILQAPLFTRYKTHHLAKARNPSLVIRILRLLHLDISILLFGSFFVMANFC